jgi:hypothetical protein
MTRTQTRLLQAALASVVGIGCLFVSEKIASTTSGSLVSEAGAIIGRPLTPMSYAGVARRTTRRAVVAAPVYAAPVVVAPVVVAPACGQAVNAYGQIVTVCR